MNCSTSITQGQHVLTKGSQHTSEARAPTNPHTIFQHIVCLPLNRMTVGQHGQYTAVLNRL